MLSLTDLTVADVMTVNPVCLRPDATLADASSTLLAKRLTGAPVVGADESPLTVVSTADLLRAYSTEPDAGSVAKQGIATAVQQVPVTCEGSMALTLACERMVRARTHQLLVVDGGRLVGVLSSTDVVRAVACIDDLRKSGRFKTDAGAASDATST
ncbi:MAG: CBS domain-containing protein [Planctomycetes bacterium]|nr:CBS domain-containing protein [Planctomycetota bacterium]